jgi:hypothetical protein
MVGIRLVRENSENVVQNDITRTGNSKYSAQFLFYFLQILQAELRSYLWILLTDFIKHNYGILLY